MTMNIGKTITICLLAMGTVPSAAAAATCPVPQRVIGTFEDPLICDDLLTGARGAAFGTPGVSLTVDLNGRNTDATAATSQGYTANGPFLPGCLARDENPVPGAADTVSGPECDDVALQDLFVE